MDGLLQITWRWLQPYQLTPAEIMEWVALECFPWGLLGEEWGAMGIKAAWIPRDMVATLQCALPPGDGEGRKEDLFQT